MATPEGTVFVRVRPLTDTFRVEAQRGITAALAGLGTAGGALAGVSSAATGALGATAALEANLAGASAAGLSAASAQTAYNRALAQGAALLPVVAQETSALNVATRRTAINTQAAQAGLVGLGRAGAAQAVGLGALAGGILVAANVAVSSVTAFASFEQELNTFQVVAGATADEMERVSETATELGRDISLPSVSAADAATAMTELARAGLSVRDSLDAARGVLSLATAAQIDNATAARIAASALNAFQLPGEQAAEVADLLAKGANSAQGSIGEFAQALAQAAAVANLAGLNLADTTNLLTQLAQAGLLGSDAGTSLRTALVRLINPTAEIASLIDQLGLSLRDAEGNIRPEFFGELGVAVNELPPALRDATLAAIGGQDALRALAILGREGAEGFGETARQLEAAAGATETASARTKGLSGDFAALQSNAETLGVALGELAAGPVGELVGGLAAVAGVAISATDALQDLGDIEVPGLGRLGDAIGDISDDLALNLLLPGLGQTKIAVDAIAGAFGGADKEADQLGSTLGSLAGRFSGADNPLRNFAENLEASLKRAERQVPVSLEQLRRTLRTEGVKIGEEFAETGDAAAARLSLNLAVVKAGQEGKKVGRALIAGFVDGASEAEQLAVDAAEDALSDAIEAGNRQVEAAIRGAKQNLTALGQDLSAQLGTLIDEGPLGQRLAQLEATLSGKREANERKRLVDSLSDAQRDLKEAEDSIQIVGEITPEQRRDIEDFLDPLRDKVRDATAALEEFNSEGVIADLKAAAEKQKEAVQRGIEDVIARFNAGKATLQQVNTQIAVSLRSVGITNAYKFTGKKLGAAFALGFQETLAAIRAELTELAREAGRGAITTRPTADIAGARAGAAQGVAEATVALTQAQQDLLQAQVDAQAVTNQILIDIRDRQRTVPRSKASSIGRGRRSPPEADALAQAGSNPQGTP